MLKAQIFILGNAAAMAVIGYVLVALNKDSLGAVAVTTYIGIVVMTVSLKLSGYLIPRPQAPSDPAVIQYGDVMDWAMLMFVWPSFAAPLIVLPYFVGNVALLFGLFVVGISLFALIGVWAVKISHDRISGKRRHSKWFYFIPSFLYAVPAMVIGYFVVASFSENMQVMRIANAGGLVIGGFFSFYCIKLALFDLFTYDVRKYGILDFLPLVLVLIFVPAVAEYALPLFAGKVEQMYLLYSLSIFALTTAQVLGVLSVTRRAKF